MINNKNKHFLNQLKSVLKKKSFKTLTETYIVVKPIDMLNLFSKKPQKLEFTLYPEHNIQYKSVDLIVSLYLNIL